MYESIGQGIWDTLKLDSLARYISFILHLHLQHSSAPVILQSFESLKVVTQKKKHRKTHRQTDCLTLYIHLQYIVYLNILYNYFPVAGLFSQVFKFQVGTQQLFPHPSFQQYCKHKHVCLQDKCLLDVCKIQILCFYLLLTLKQQIKS